MAKSGYTILQITLHNCFYNIKPPNVTPLSKTNYFVHLVKSTNIFVCLTSWLKISMCAHHSFLSPVMMFLFELMALASALPTGKPFLASCMLGKNRSFHGSLPCRLWAISYPRISPGTAMDKPPVDEFFKHFIPCFII